MIKPTVGRVVWYTPYQSDTFAYTPGQPLAAIVTAVWSDTCVNLAVFDANGNSHGRTSVLLWQDDGDNPKPDCGFCEWMPYQKGQAARTEQLESAMKEGNGAQ